MSFEGLGEFLLNMELWQKVVAGLILAAIVAAVGVAWRRWRGKKEPGAGGISVKAGDEASIQISTAQGTRQELKVDRSRREARGGQVLFIEHAQNVIIINRYDYRDGVEDSPVIPVRQLFREGLAHLERKEYRQAIDRFQGGLSLEKDGRKRGALYLQAGNGYYELRQFSEAAACYEKALREARAAGDREGETSALGSLANAYLQRPASTGEARGTNVRSAVDSYQKALRIFTKEEYPVDYAATQNNLGNAYGDLPAATPEERAQNLKKVVTCYQEALEIYQKDQYPVEYATTQNNLGTAYRVLPAASAEERAKNVRKAIRCFEEALEIYQKDQYPVEYAGTQNNLGNAYMELLAASAEERAGNVKKAIRCYQEALEIRKKDQYPVDYAATQNNLGTAYMELPAASAEERAENLKKAIRCYQEALEIRKKDQYPHLFCFTAANLGMVLAEAGKKAEACYWLREAYSLREYLPDQGKGLEEVMRRVCGP